MPGTVPHRMMITSISQMGQYVNTHRMQGWGPVALGVRDPVERIHFFND